MKIKVTREESALIKNSLVLSAKQPGVAENIMVKLLMISQKFAWVENPPKTTGSATVTTEAKPERKDEQA